MKHKIVLLLSTLILVITMGACGKEEETTLTGMVMSIDGTKISLREMDSQMQMGDMPDMPSGKIPDMENMEGFENFNPEDLAEGTEMPSKPEFDTQISEEDTTTVELADAHISVEIEGGKASGSMDDIEKGSFLTITMNGKGEVTNVLVSSKRGFGGSKKTQ